jgi:hydrogenase maturation protease
VSTVVLGIGNPFRRDDGVGPAVVGLLGSRVGPGVHLAVSDGEPTGLLDAWSDGGAVVVVDAVRSGTTPPGRVHRWVLGPAPARDGLPAVPPPTGTHGLGLADAVALAAALGRPPRSVVVYGVEVADTGWGPGLSPPVAAAARAVAERVLTEPPVRARLR